MWQIGPRENDGRKENGGPGIKATACPATACCPLALASTASPQRATLLGTQIPLPTCKEADLLVGRSAPDSSWCCAQPGFILGGQHQENLVSSLLMASCWAHRDPASPQAVASCWRQAGKAILYVAEGLYCGMGRVG